MSSLWTNHTLTSLGPTTVQILLNTKFIQRKWGSFDKWFVQQKRSLIPSEYCFKGIVWLCRVPALREMSESWFGVITARLTSQVSHYGSVQDWFHRPVSEGVGVYPHSQYISCTGEQRAATSEICVAFDPGPSEISGNLSLAFTLGTQHHW